MAESRLYIPNQPLDLDRILIEAQYRWLRPSEICEILRNHHRFQLKPDPPVQPPAGSLFLFDRKVIRYFRKDGYRWRKKKDGKTVKEAHEKLKANSVDVLHCYYAHGEDNESFQRRSYWMLDARLEHIVLVHYREVKEGYKSGISRLIADPGSQAGSPQSSPVPWSAQANSPAPTVQTSYASSANRVDRNGLTLSSEFEDVDSGSDPRASSLTQPLFGSFLHKTSLLEHKVAGFPDLSRSPPASWVAGTKYHQGSGLSNCAETNSSSNSNGVHDQKLFTEHPRGADFLTHKLTDARLDANSSVQDVTKGDRLIAEGNQTYMGASLEIVQVQREPGFISDHPQFQSCSDPHIEVKSTFHAEKKSKDGVNNNEAGELKKLDSFGRWMDKEIGGDCDDSLMASDSGNYWNTLDADNDDKEVSSLSHHMHLDTDMLGPSLAQEQLFTIQDFSPDWTYSGDTTVDTAKDSSKVLIVGTFLVSKEISSKIKWGCMFGEIEVSAEVLTDTVIRCHTPQHAPGRVPFYITRSDRLACSEVREFEYREKPSGIGFHMAVKSASEDEVRFQMRLVKLLNLGRVRNRFNCSNQDCDKCKLKSTIYSMKSESGNDLGRVEETSMTFNSNHMIPRDRLIQCLLKDSLSEWLILKVHEGGKGPHVLDYEGQGVIHLAAALGYEWAMGPIVSVGVSPNFRDAHGRTGLHWASYFGREEAVIALLRLGAAPGAVEDPTPESPGGKTAADLASSRGHKGIAGYLAEADLTSHLSSLTVNENVMDTVAASIAAEKAIENAAQVVPLDVAEKENLSLRESLAAVRKSAHAAALIQAAFRARSFNHRQSSKNFNDISEATLDLVALGSLNKVRKLGHFEEYLHSAAVKIQQRYRGWKGRKEFLKIRTRIVKIQAHVRGHQVRKQYKRVVWSVSIVEKAILRWRRKGSGLRGFRVDKVMGDVASETEKTDEYEFLRIGRKQKFAGVEKALARVRSMVRYPEARDQYMRLVTKFGNLKIQIQFLKKEKERVMMVAATATRCDMFFFSQEGSWI
ncbi:calmodulin-binding transcription activator 3-like isoform X2 [Juglans regia]|uniref:Calmodulin-binding transcription activator 3-like isoform X2 n=1 Tax=Juglans regia TaxID=51240 RepID=A0A6P9DVU2_JUGRE|nr:calmodulin-binding transcription activator 3-like isoform X2 [Juglans regia]